MNRLSHQKPFFRMGRFLWALVWMVLPGAVFAEALELVNLEGKTIKAHIISKNESSVGLRMEGKSKVFRVPLSKFDGASQKKIRAIEILSERVEIEVDVNKRGRDVSQSSKFGEVSSHTREREETLSGKMVIKNDDGELHSPAAQVSFVFLVKGRARGHFRMLGAQSHLVPALGPISETHKELRTARSHYGEGYQGEAVGDGGRYIGYVAVLHRGQEVIASKCIPTAYEAYLSEVIERGRSDESLKESKQEYKKP